MHFKVAKVLDNHCRFSGEFVTLNEVRHIAIAIRVDGKPVPGCLQRYLYP